MKKYAIFSLLFLLFSTVTVLAEINSEKKQEILDTKECAPLIAAIQAPGDTPDDIFMKMLACKRLAVIGTAEAVPSLEKMLANPKLNHAARFALEQMPCAESDQALLRGVKNLSGQPAVGCIQSVGVKKSTGAMAVLKEKYASCDCPKVRKAIYAAMGMIASDEAIDWLMARMKAAPDTDIHVWMGLGDALLDAAENCEKEGNYAKAIIIYDACVNPVFPVFLQKASAYHSILARKDKAAELLVSKMFSPKECCFTGGLKTIREFECANGEMVTKAILNILEKLPVDRQSFVLMAIAEREDETSQKLIYPVLLAKLANPKTQLAALRGLKKVGGLDPLKTGEAVCKNITAETDLNAVIAVAEALPAGIADEKMVELAQKADFSKVPAALGAAYLKAIELRRITAAGPVLVKIANTEGIDSSVRDAALYALADIVTLDSLDLLVDALANEKNDQKASWILRSACTRLPREECAVQVTKLFEKAQTPVDQEKMLTLLKQIGGLTALACVEKACWNEATADLATKVLGTWNTPDDMKAVAAASLKLAQKAPEHYAIRGIRSYVRIARQFDLPAAQKFAMCRTAFETAKRDSEKILIFEVFKRIIEVSSAREAMSYAEIPAFREAACDACVAIALKFQGISEEFVTLLERVIEISQVENTKSEAQRALSRLDAMVKSVPVIILSARYGVEGKWKDVSDIVKKKFNGKSSFGLTAGNAAFGDSAPGQVKTTEIIVKFNATGEQRKLVFEENEAVILPEK